MLASSHPLRFIRCQLTAAHRFRVLVERADSRLREPLADWLGTGVKGVGAAAPSNDCIQSRSVNTIVPVNLLIQKAAALVSNPDIDWERPRPHGYLARDIIGWLITLLLIVIHLLSLQGLGMEMFQDINEFSLYSTTAAMTLPLIIRRAFPLTAMIVGTVLFFVLGSIDVLAGVQLGFQACYFALIYSAIAWATDRKILGVVTWLMILVVMLWIITGWVITGSAYFMTVDPNADTAGPFSPSTASLIAGVLINTVYFGGAIAFGRSSYHRAYQQAVLERQALQLEQNAEQMAADAATKDRLRIARELHDSIGHHVSAIGIQASAARRLLDKSPEAAGLPLENISSSARSAVDEMRSVLGVLRAEEADGTGETTRDEPQLAEIETLAAKLEPANLRVDVSRVEHQPGALDQLSRGVQLSFYRIAQEALNNTVKHSGARNAWLSLRTGESGGGWVEIEVVDDGVSAGSCDGSGLGLRGLRERATALGGTCQAGPRKGSAGWRVRVRIPYSFSAETASGRGTDQ